MSKKNENKIAFKEINLLPSSEGLEGLEVLEGLEEEVPVQVLPVAIASLPPERETALNPSAVNLVKVIAELLKALVILQVITALFAAVVAAGIEQEAVAPVGAENVGVHVVTDDVADPNVPVTVNEYSLLAQLPSSLLAYVKVFNVPSQVLPVAIAWLAAAIETAVNPVASNLVKVIAEELKALIILQVITALFASVVAAGIVQVAVASAGAVNVGVHVVSDDVAEPTVPTTVNEYSLLVQAPSVLLTNVKVLSVQFMNYTIIKRDNIWNLISIRIIFIFFCECFF